MGRATIQKDSAHILTPYSPMVHFHVIEYVRECRYKVNAVVRSRNHCYLEKKTASSLCIVDIHVAVNNIKPFSVAMETQQLVPFALLSSYKIRVFLTAVNKIKYRVFQKDGPNFKPLYFTMATCYNYTKNYKRFSEPSSFTNHFINALCALHLLHEQHRDDS